MAAWWEKSKITRFVLIFGCIIGFSVRSLLSNNWIHPIMPLSILPNLCNSHLDEN